MDFNEIGFVQCAKDLINYFRFKKEMKTEFYRKDSQFNKLDLHLNWLGNVVYTQLNFKNEDFMNFNYDAEAMVTKRIQPIVEYLSRDMNWGDYLTPQISNFVDEDNNPTLSYGVLFVYSPYRLTVGKLIMNFLVTVGIITGICIWAF